MGENRADPTPGFTIAVCTRNRAALLSRTLAAITAQIGTDRSAEVIVVDNASTDQTRQVVESQAGAAYHCEPTLGIAYARNRAAHIARGEWLIYVDDDAVPVPGWWAAMRACAERQTPRPACILGRVTLDWEDGQAAWFPAAYETLLSRFDLGDQGHYLGADGYLLTTNTAFDRARLLALGGFRTDLGHRGASLLGGEDNDIFNRLIAGGGAVWYEPRALAAHWVPRARQTRRWLIRRVFWDGATQPLLDYGSSQPRRRYLRELGRDLRRVLRLTMQRRSDGAFGLLLEWTRQAGRGYMNAKLALRTTPMQRYPHPPTPSPLRGEGESGINR